MSRFARQSSNTNDPVSPHTVALQHLRGTLAERNANERGVSFTVG